MNQTNKKRLTTLDKILIAVAVAIGVPILLLALFIFWPTKYPATEADYPLGDKLEYLGAEHYGCRFLCDAAPSSVLYYGTDMTTDKLKNYFNATDLREETSTAIVDNSKIRYKSITLKLSSDYLFISYYSDATVLKSIDDTTTDKLHFITIDYSQYRTALDSL